jgi:hypothetical protein
VPPVLALNKAEFVRSKKARIFREKISAIDNLNDRRSEPAIDTLFEASPFSESNEGLFRCSLKASGLFELF